MHTKQQLLAEPEEEELDEEEEDPATASPIVDTLSSITVEWMVLYSKTYRIPQLCFNVYGSSKSLVLHLSTDVSSLTIDHETAVTPLSLSELLSTGIFLQSPRDTTTIHDDHLNLGPGGDPFDTAAQFPLLQKISHPYPHAGSSNVSFAPRDDRLAVNAMTCVCIVCRDRLVDTSLSCSRFRSRSVGINPDGSASQGISSSNSSWIDRWE